MGQSSLSAALRHGSHASADVVQFRPSVFRFPTSPLDRLDGGEQAFTSTGRFLRGRFFLRQSDLHLVDLGADRASSRLCFESPPEHAISLHRDFVPFRNRIAGRLEISVPGSWNLLLLLGGLFEATCAGHKRVAVAINCGKSAKTQRALLPASSVAGLRDGKQRNTPWDRKRLMMHRWKASILRRARAQIDFATTSIGSVGFKKIYCSHGNGADEWDQI